MAYVNNPGFVGVRSPDGLGNNEGGQAFSEYIRLSDPSYADGKQSFVISGPGIPAPRDISNALMVQPQVGGVDISVPSSFGVNENFQFFAQFLTHDMSQGSIGRAPGRTAPDFPAFTVEGSFPITRTDANLDANLVRQQISEETSFLDLSMVYGSNAGMLDLLRDNTNTAKLVAHEGNMLATVGDVVANNPGMALNTAAGILGLASPFGPVNPDTYATGDQRANQTPMLLTLQTVFAREHNRLADELKDKNPGWTNDEVFNAARALNEAQWQHIVYNEYLPKLLGAGAIDRYTGHDINVNPGASNEWANVAFRFGHDQASNIELKVAEDGTVIGSIKLAEAFRAGLAGVAFGSPNGEEGLGAQQSANLDQFMRGLTQQTAQEIDGKVVDGNRNALFGIPGATVDLEVSDLFRAREHGVSNLNDLRDGMGLKAYTNVNQFVGQNNTGNALGREVREKLQDLYGNEINNVDATLAGLLEKNVKGAMVGETFHAIIEDQFERTRDGDQQFYLNRFANNADLIREIEGTSFADLIMRNTDTTVYRDAFMTYNRTTGDGGAGRDLVIGSEAADNQKGNAGNDDLYGFGGNDTQNGGDGNDLMNGGAGNDTQTGSKGADIFVYAGLSAGQDTITDFRNNEDRMDVSDYDLTFAQVRAKTTQVGKNVVIDIGEADGGRAGVNTITLVDFKIAQIDGSDFLFV